MILTRVTALLLLAGPALAQWGSNPAVNFAVADGVATQTQPKLAPTADGGCYVSWFDSDPNGTPAFGFDVRIQRLDAAGNELWAHGGVLVADRGFSSTQDYGLDVDVNGDALLTFRDDRGTGTQITATKVDATGAQPWGATGVQLTNTVDFVAAPKIAGASDGKLFVAWTQNNDTHVQRLDTNGNILFGADVVIAPAGAGSWSVSDMQTSDLGSVVLGLVFQAGGFGSPRHLFAQKLDRFGSLLWGAGHVPVFDGGSLQFGNFPTFVSDQAGGAVFGWYSSSPALECRVQRVLSAGTEVFPHDGVTASTDATQLRVSPSVAFDAATGESYLAYTELNGTQSLRGVSAQKFSSAGARLWGATGSSIVALGTDDIGDVGLPITGAGATVCWTAAAGFGQDVLRCAVLDDAGATRLGPFDVSSTPATKFRVQAVESADGTGLLAWQDDGAGNDDIATQSVRTDGALGPLLIQTGTSISLAAGGVINWELNAGTDDGSALYWFLGTTTGTSPGQALTPTSLTLPLNFSNYFLFTLLNPGTLVIGSLAFLTPSGQSLLALFLPPGLDPGLAGVVFHHAYILLDPVNFQATQVSNAVRMELVP